MRHISEGGAAHHDGAPSLPGTCRRILDSFSFTLSGSPGPKYKLDTYTVIFLWSDQAVANTMSVATTAPPAAAADVLSTGNPLELGELQPWAGTPVLDDGATYWVSVDQTDGWQQLKSITVELL